jgi:hypothetical protein
MERRGRIELSPRVALPTAEAHGNEIEGDAVEDYIGVLLAARLDTEPLLLTQAAIALRTQADRAG